jgi:hypothetical protein
VTLPRPTASLLLDGGGASPLGGSALNAAQAAVRRLVVELSVDEAHDRVELAVWRGSALSGAAPGAKLTVGLGDRADVADVLTVEVAGTDATGWGAVITGYAPSRRLSSTYVGRSYVDRTVGDVVSDLLSEGEVDEGDVDASLSLSVLHVDPRRSVWANLHALGRRSGCQVTTKEDGSVSFTPIPGAVSGGFGATLRAVAAAAGMGSSGELREGAELLVFRVGPRNPDPTVSLLTPFGAKAGLLVAEPDTSSGRPVQVDSMLRTQEAADAATTAREAAARRRGRTASVSVPGRPGLRAGGTVKARGEDYRVLRARHVLDADSGYRCDLLLEGDQ